MHILLQTLSKINVCVFFLFCFFYSIFFSHFQITYISIFVRTHTVLHRYHYSLSNWFQFVLFYLQYNFFFFIFLLSNPRGPRFSRIICVFMVLCARMTQNKHNCVTYANIICTLLLCFNIYRWYCYEFNNNNFPFDEREREKKVAATTTTRASQPN